MRRKSIVRVANEVVLFPQAAAWAGIDVPYQSGERGVKVYCPFGTTEHPDGGTEPAMRVYPDHGWCFAESRYFSVVSLLAEVWQVPREEAAETALDRIGWKPQDYGKRFAQAAAAPEPDEDALAAALVTWCETMFPDWRERQYDARVSRCLAHCLGLLPLVHSAGDCEIWLGAVKQAMTSVLTGT